MTLNCDESILKEERRNVGKIVESARRRVIAHFELRTSETSSPYIDGIFACTEFCGVCQSLIWNHALSRRSARRSVANMRHFCLNMFERSSSGCTRALADRFDIDPNNASG